MPFHCFMDSAVIVTEEDCLHCPCFDDCYISENDLDENALGYYYDY